MDFRGIVLIALWTLLSGPIFAPPPSAPARAKAAVVKVAPKKASFTAVALRR